MSRASGGAALSDALGFEQAHRQTDWATVVPTLARVGIGPGAHGLRQAIEEDRQKSPGIFRPLRWMLPEVGSIRRLNSRTMVDLPEPDSPMMTKISRA
jgi:hypothetical protein